MNVYVDFISYILVIRTDESILLFRNMLKTTNASISGSV
jgi:hypothetical protein